MKCKLERVHLGVIIAMCGIVGASVGINISTAGVFYNPMAEVMGVGKGAISMTTTIMSILMAFTSMLIPVLLKHVNVRKLLWFSVACLVIGTVMCALSTQLWQLYIWNGLKGIGAGLTGFVLATMIINNWIYVNHGLIVSIVMSFSGVAGVMFSSPFSMIISNFGYQTAYFVMAVLIFVFYVPALFFPLAIKPEEIGLKPYGYEAYLEHKKQTSDTAVHEGGAREHSIDGFKLGILFVFTTLVCVIAALFMHLSGYAEVLGLGAGVGAMLISAVNLANVCAKLVYGTMADRIGTWKSSLLVGTVSFIGIVGFLFVKSAPLLLVCSLLYGCTMPNSAIALSLSVSDIFGPENYSRVYPVVNLVGSLTNSLGITMLGFLYDAAQSYIPLFILCLVMQGLAMVFITILYQIRKS
ncbi:MAG: MFS transporter [Bulleidia sp.]